MARKKRINQRVTTTSDPEELPPCPGPKLHAFPYQNSPIEWLERLDEEREGLPGGGTDGYVFKVKIESQFYALKVFKFFNPEDTRFYWGPILKGSFPSQTVAFHTDPFYAECRAYGRIKEAQDKGLLKRQIVIPCLGFILLQDKYRAILEQSGIDLEEDCLDDDVEPLSPEPSSRLRRPVRAIVKELASQDSGVNPKSLKKILRDIKKLNKLEIYNRDIRIDNFKDGKLVDFGSSWTEPHCFMHSADKEQPKETRLGDLVMFDDMIELEGFETDVRATPSWSHCKKLRSQAKKAGYEYFSL